MSWIQNPTELYSLIEVQQLNDGLSKYVCSHCYSKSKKLSKEDFDLMKKLEELRKEKNELIKSMREHLKRIQAILCPKISSIYYCLANYSIFINTSWFKPQGLARLSDSRVFFSFFVPKDKMIKVSNLKCISAYCIDKYSL